MLLGGSVSGQQIPRLVNVPANLPAGQRDALSARRATLVEARAALKNSIDAHNRKLALENSADEAALLREGNELRVQTQNHVNASGKFNADVASAQRLQASGHRSAGALRTHLHDTQDALRQLQRQGELTTAELEHWREVTDQTVEHAQEMLGDMLLDALIEVPAARLDGLYKGMEAELTAQVRLANDLIINATDPGRRQRLQAALLLLTKQREAVRHVQELLGNFAQARAVKGLDELAQMPEAQKLKTGLQELIVASGDEKLQEGFQRDLGISFPVATSLAQGVAHYRAAEKVVAAAYDVTAVSLAWKQISLQNDTAQQVLDAVGVLGQRVEKLVGRIKEIE